MEWLAAIALLTAVVFGLKSIFSRMRHRKLMEKYGDVEAVDNIMARQMWQGMSAEMLVDCLGKPVDVDEKLYKTKNVHTYKYHQRGSNRYRTRVKLENGVVVGWDLK